MKLLKIFLLLSISLSVISAEVSDHESLLQEEKLLSDKQTTAYQNGDYLSSIEYIKQSIVIKEKVFGEEHINTANSYDDLGGVYRKMGEYPNALDYYTRALIIREKVLGKEHIDIAESYENFGDIHDNMGDYPSALKYHEKAFSLREKLLGEEHIVTAESYDDLGRVYKKMGNYSEALQYYNKALSIREKVLGREHIDIAESYNSLGVLYKKMGKYPKALEYALKTMLLDEKILGENHPYTAESYGNLSDIYINMGEYPKALKYYKKALATQEIVLGREHPNTAESYDDLGGVYKKMGKYPEALKHYEVALAIRKKILGEEHADTAESYNSLGVLYKKMGDYPKALKYAHKTMVLDEKILGKKHPYTATSYGNLGDIYDNLGDYPKALKFYKKALVIQKKRLGKEHPYVAESYDDLGGLYQKMGDYPKALKYYQQAVTIREKILGEHADTAESYHSLGVLYRKMGDYPRALEYAHRTMILDEKILGKEHPYTATSYEDLGDIFGRMGDDAKAMAYQKKALAIREKVLGKEHTDTAESYCSLGKLYQKTDDDSKAMKYYRQAAEIRETILGKEHADTAESYLSMGTIYRKTGDHSQAYHYAKLSFDIFLKNRDKNFIILNSKQKEKYLRANQEKINLLLSTSNRYFIQLKNECNTKGAQELLISSINAWLNYQGSIFDSENAIAMLYATTKDMELKERIHGLISSKRYLAKLYQSLPEPKKRELWKKRIKETETLIEVLSNDIASRASKFKEQQGLKSINYKFITSQLREDELYIDYARTGKHYYFFSLNSKEEIHFVQIDVNSTRDIDTLVNTFMEDINLILSDHNPTNKKLATLTQNSKEKLSKLYTLLIEQYLGEPLRNRSSLIISLDGVLRRLPFEALYDQANQKYLIEEKEIRYIPSGKELVRLYRYSKNREASNTLVIFADPDFDTKAPSVSKEKRIISSDTSRAGIIKSLFRMRFASLPGTKAEATAIKTALRRDDISEYQKERASEMNLMEIREPKILHIATHGFFLKDKSIPNPMLRSGIALAGANASAIRGKNNGIVTALKLSGLDLKGTDLVVLSACQTGVIDINATDSLSGLSKAFIQAGAKDIITSLWSVDDQATKELMTSFYQEMKENKNYAEALKAAKLKMIAEDRHPFYWGAFVVSGL